MSWEQISTAITFAAFYVESKVGKTGLTVTVDVYRNGTAIVTDGATVEVGGGLYTYTLGSGSVTVEGEYLAIFKTATATVDQQHIPALMLVGRAGVENLNATISSRSSHAAADIWSVGTRTLTSFGTLVADAAAAVWASVARTLTASPGPSAATIADAVLDELVSGHTTAGSVGHKLSLIGAASVTITAPVAADGTLDLVRGDDYLEAQSREITFSSSSWPDLTGVTEIKLTIRRRKEAFGTGSDPIILTVLDVSGSRDIGGSPQVLVFELFSATPQSGGGDAPGFTGDTNDLLVGDATGKYDVQVTLANGEIITLATGTIDVTEDQTRP